MNIIFPFIYLFDAMHNFLYAILASFGVLAAATSAQPPFGAISNDLNVSLLHVSLVLFAFHTLTWSV